MRRGAGLDHAAAEAVLSGAAAGTPVGRVLVLARSPAAGHELRGEDAAVAAFRAAYMRRPRRLTRRLLTVKVAAVGVLVAGSGLALANATGTLPLPSGYDEPAPADRPTPADPGRTPTAGATPRADHDPPRPPAATGAPKGPDARSRSPHPRGGPPRPTPSRKPHRPGPPSGTPR